MIYSQMNPLLIDQLIVLISATFMDCFSTDEQEVIGNFFSTLGSIISFNSAYISYVEGKIEKKQDEKNEQKDDQENTNEDNNYELLKKSIEKIQEQMKNIKKEKSQSQ